MSIYETIGLSVTVLATGLFIAAFGVLIVIAAYQRGLFNDTKQH